MSIIETSSTIITSASIGAPSYLLVFLYKLSSSILPISNNLCNVDASFPVVSVILFAALPVGAAKITFFPLSSYISIIFFIIVVFPVPGPPVIIVTLFSFTNFNASFCFSDNSILDSFSAFFNTLSKPVILFIFLEFCNLFILNAISSSAL